MYSLWAPNDVKRLGDFLRLLYVLQDMDSLYRTICGGLGDLVCGDNIFIGEHDMQRTLVTGCTVRHLFTTPDFITIVNQCAGEHPLWEPIRTGGQEVRLLSDYASARAWENTHLYKEALGLEGVRDHISVEFGNRANKLVSVGVFRTKRGFDHRDARLMAFLLPHLELALENARLAGTAGLAAAHAEEAGAENVLLLDGDGHPVEPSPNIRSRLAHFFPGREWINDRLPLSVCGWVRRSRDWLDRGGQVGTLQPLRTSRRGRSIELRLMRRRFVPGYVVLFKERFSVAEGLATLTPREREVLHWVAEGKTNDEIALILDTAVTTVKTHLKHLFCKLGVDNRTAAARFARLGS